MNKAGKRLTQPSSRPPTDRRRERRRFDRNLFWAVVIFLVGVGGTLIALVFGLWQAAAGLVCLLAGAGIFGLLWLILSLMERWSRDD